MAARAAASTARRTSVFRSSPSSTAVAPRSSTAAPRLAPPPAVQVTRRSMSSNIDEAVKEEIRRLEDSIRLLDNKIRAVDSQSFARYKEISVECNKTSRRLTTIFDGWQEADMKKAQDTVTDIIFKANTYFKDINVSWKVSFAMMSIASGLGYMFLEEVRKGWQDICTKNSEKNFDEKLKPIKEEMLELRKQLEEKNNEKGGDTQQ